MGFLVQVLVHSSVLGPVIIRVMGGILPFQNVFRDLLSLLLPFQTMLWSQKYPQKEKKIQQGMMGYLLINSITNKSKALASFVLTKRLAQDEQNKGN